MAKCKNCGNQIQGWCDYCNDDCYNAYQYKKVEKENADLRKGLQQEHDKVTRLAEKLHHVSMNHGEWMKANEKQRVTIAALRLALDKLARLGNEPNYGNSIGNEIAQQALSDTTGAELLDKIETTEIALKNRNRIIEELQKESVRLEQENQALRCCGNCRYQSHKPPKECIDCGGIDNEYAGWQLAERLVSKSE